MHKGGPGRPCQSVSSGEMLKSKKTMAGFVCLQFLNFVLFGALVFQGFSLWPWPP